MTGITRENRPAVSVIVPVYHVEETLASCLDSLLEQSFADFELILVNDGGTEAETALCRKYASADHRIHLIEQENRGLSAARNRGLEAACGEWIMFVDSDDRVSPDFIKIPLNAVRETGADAAVFDVIIREFWHAGDEIRQCTRLPAGVISGEEALYAKVRGEITGFAWDKIYSAGLWETIRFPEGELWEDEAVMPMILDRAEKVVILHDCLYYKYTRKEGIMFQSYSDRSLSYWIYRQRRKGFEYLKEHHPEMLVYAREQIYEHLFNYAEECLVSGNTAGFEDARSFAREEALDGHKSISVRLRLAALRQGRLPFRVISRALEIYHKRRGSIGTEQSG